MCTHFCIFLSAIKPNIKTAQQNILKKGSNNDWFQNYVAFYGHQDTLQALKPVVKVSKAKLLFMLFKDNGLKHYKPLPVCSQGGYTEVEGQFLLFNPGQK